LLQVRPHTFPAVREQLLRRYRNAMLQPGKAAAALRLQCLAGGPHWSSDQLAAALEAVKGMADVQVRGFWACICMGLLFFMPVQQHWQQQGAKRLPEWWCQ
jgi:hypothetical protein